MQTQTTDRSLQDRKHAAVEALASLAKWPHCQASHNQGSVNDFNQAVYNAVANDYAPSFVWNDRQGRVLSYRCQIFCETVADVLTASEESIRERLDGVEDELKNGVGKPTATDGSKGQWRAAKQAEIETLRWLLEGDDK